MDSKTFLRAIWTLACAILIVAGEAQGAPESAPPNACGVPGKPACPLQHWMRRRLATALGHRDYRELDRRLSELVAKNPEPKAWHNWSKFARDGASAAREGRLGGVIAACSRCHSIYRPEYNVKYRQRR